jgi:hypothetical protein
MIPNLGSNCYMNVAKLSRFGLLLSGLYFLLLILTVVKTFIYPDNNSFGDIFGGYFYLTLVSYPGHLFLEPIWLLLGFMRMENDGPTFVGNDAALIVIIIGNSMAFLAALYVVGYAISNIIRGIFRR